MISGRRCGAFSALVLLGLACQPDGPPPPDIVVFLTDDQRADLFLEYMPRTKALLADSGVVFSHAFANTPNCCPSRATFLTGLYQHNHGVLNNVPPDGGAMELSTRGTIGVWLQRGGYLTAYFGGKWLNEYSRVEPWPHVPPGWDEWHVPARSVYYDYTLVERTWPDSVVTQTVHGGAPSDYATDVMTGKIVAFLKRLPENRPVFLVVATSAPHRPSLPAPRDVDACRRLEPPRSASYDETDTSDKPQFVRRVQPATGAMHLQTDSIWRGMCGSLQAVDRMVEAVINGLAERERLDRTFILYTSDNGIALGEHRLWWRKGTAYDHDVRVPFVVRVPGVEPRLDTAFVQMADIAPTLLDWAGITPTSPMDGQSLLPHIERYGALARDAILIENLWTRQRINPAVRAVRTRRYLYAEYESGERELYDLATDPYQLDSRHADAQYDSVRVRLARRLARLSASEKKQ